MANPKKHHTRWFTSRDMRAINLDWVTYIAFSPRGHEPRTATLTINTGLNTGEYRLILVGEDVDRLADRLY